MSYPLTYETQDGRMLPARQKKAKSRPGTKWVTPKVNPLIAVYGTTPGKKCGTCTHHYFNHYSKKYPKCELRKNGHTQRTDHSSRYDACGKWEEKKN